LYRLSNWISRRLRLRSQPFTDARTPEQSCPAYNRGHLIPHTAGSGLDINLFLQLAKVNRGPFRSLERRAIKCPGCFYLVRLIYDSKNDGQLPDEIEQALFPVGASTPAEWRRFDNCVPPPS
jgi:hypothetical protein